MKAHIYTPIARFKGVIVVEPFPSRVTRDMETVRIAASGTSFAIVGHRRGRFFSSQVVRNVQAELGARHPFDKTIEGLVKLSVITMDELKEHISAVTAFRDRAECRQASWAIINALVESNLTLTPEQYKQLVDQTRS